MKMKKQIRAILPLVALALVSTSAQAGTVALTSVDQLDFTNVVKAYDFTGSNSIASDGATFDIGGVTFTRHRWNDAVANGGNGTTFDGTTLINVNNSDNQGSGAPNISAGGTATDQANLSELLDWWNIGHGGDVDISIAGLANGAYKIQFIVGVSGTRDNELFDITAGAPGVSLGAFSGGSANFLITGDVAVIGGTLTLRLTEGIVAGGDNRRLISGLIISTITAAAPFAITEIEYDPDAEPFPTVSLTWRNSGAASYAAFYSLDMTTDSWGADLNDNIAADEGDTTTETFELPESLWAEGSVFFRIEER